MIILRFFTLGAISADLGCTGAVALASAKSLFCEILDSSSAASNSAFLRNSRSLLGSRVRIATFLVRIATFYLEVAIYAKFVAFFAKKLIFIKKCHLSLEIGLYTLKSGLFDGYPAKVFR